MGTRAKTRAPAQKPARAREYVRKRGANCTRIHIRCSSFPDRTVCGKVVAKSSRRGQPAHLTPEWERATQADIDSGIDICSTCDRMKDADTMTGPARAPLESCPCGAASVTRRLWRAPDGQSGGTMGVCEKHRDELDAAGSSREAQTLAGRLRARARKSPARADIPLAVVAPSIASEPRGGATPAAPTANTATPPPRGARAAIYVRVSTDEQELANQRPELERLARARGYEFFPGLDLFEEKASAAGARPKFAEMMDRAHAGLIDAVIVWAIDRFGRSMIGNVRDVLELERRGVHVISAREPWLDTSGPVRDLLLAIFSWVAEQERRRLGERTRAGMDRARATGKTVGRPRARIDANALELELGARQGRGMRLRPKLSTIARRLGVSEATLRRELARRRDGQNGSAAL